MKTKLLIGAVFVMSVLLYSSMVSAVSVGPAASILYLETELGDDYWQYDYVFNNESTGGEYLYSVVFDFDGEHEFTGSPLPTGWDGIVGEPTTSFAMVYTVESVYDIAPGSSLGGFSFVIDYQAGNIPYTAYFDNHDGGYSYLEGTTALAPEPISSILFLSGGAALAFSRRYLKKDRKGNL